LTRTGTSGTEQAVTPAIEDGQVDLRLAVIVFGLAALVLIVAALTLRAARWLDRRRRQARATRALDGEDDSEALLEEAGYEILGRQVAGELTLVVDGEAIGFGLRADFLVARDGARFVAEVKTGERAPRLGYGPTRRQLLEYVLAFEVCGAVLVDADTGALTVVELS
jgi:hypothetical protein